MVQAAGGAEAVDYPTHLNSPALVFSEAIKRVRTAYTLAFAADAELSAPFFDELQSLVPEWAAQPGVSWSDIGDKFWTPLMMRIQRAFDVYHKSMTAAPSLSAAVWLDPSSPEKVEMLKLVGLASARAEARSLLEKRKEREPRSRRDRSKSTGDSSKGRGKDARLSRAKGTSSASGASSRARKQPKKTTVVLSDSASAEGDEDEKEQQDDDENEADGSDEDAAPENRVRSAREQWCRGDKALKALAKRLKVKGPLCRFYFSKKGCQNTGDGQCRFSHGK